MRNVFTLVLGVLCAVLLTLHSSAVAQTAQLTSGKKPCESNSLDGTEVTEGASKAMIDTYNAKFGATGMVVLCALTGSADFSSTSVMYANPQGSVLLVVWINHSLAVKLDARIVPFVMVREMARTSIPACTLSDFPEFLSCETQLDRYALQYVGGGAISALEMIEQTYRDDGANPLLAVHAAYRVRELRKYQQHLASATK